MGNAHIDPDRSPFCAGHSKVLTQQVGDHGRTNIGAFESLEFLVLGIHGKLALWHALAVIAERDVRFQTTDFVHLTKRAETQEARVEQWRLDVARKVFQLAAPQIM